MILIALRVETIELSFETKMEPRLGVLTLKLQSDVKASEL